MASQHLRTDDRFEILFHIGFPKCGSTTLQKNIFPNLPGVMVSRSPSDRRMPTKLLDELKTDDADIDYVRRVIEQQPATTNKTCSITRDHCLRYIVSHENLSGFTRSSDRSFQVATNIYRAYPNARILIIIRRQWDALLSAYSDRVSRHGTEYRCLEQFVEQTLSTTNEIDRWQYLDLIQHYNQLFGSKNVKVLPMEMIWIDPKGFLEAISTFHCKRSNECSPLSVSFLKHRNNESVKNKRAQTVLRYTNWLALRCARFIVKDLRQQRLGYLVRYMYSGTLHHFLRPILLGIFSSKKRSLNQHEQELREQVRGYFADSNNQLSKISGIDLSIYGYSCTQRV